MADDEEGEISEQPATTTTTTATLVVYPSTSNPAANLLPKEQRIVHLPQDSQTIVGRDRSYLPLIRLKSLQVSKVHATLYRDEHDQSKWFIVDNASTHGTFVRREGEKEWTRLAEKGCASLPVELKHLDFVKFAVQRFQVHLHDIHAPTCATCDPDPSLNGSDIVPLLASQPVTAPAAAGQTAIEPNPYVACRSKEDKFQDHRKDMRSLKQSLLAGPSPQPSVSRKDTPDSNHREERYVDRAKLRRALYPTAGSDAQPGRSTSHQYQRPESTKPIEPTYGAGSALYKRMLGSSGPGADTPDTGTGTDSEHEPERKKAKVGQVIEVRRTLNRGAGLGSAMLSGVENVGMESRADWRESGRDKRWNEVFGDAKK